MSNALAIAAVTAVLKDLLDNALIDHSLSAAVGGPVTVTALAPDRIKTGDEEAPQLNLFLYRAAPNTGWRNVDLPSRDGNGQRLANPPLALNLFYLLTAYGKQDLEAEILLGYAMQLLHEMPVLTRDAIRETLKSVSPVSGGILPPAVGALVASDLADQVELIKLTPQPMSTEELSKLWAAFQANYRPSVAYQASVVLIESTLPTRSPLPVLTRGRPDPTKGRDEGVIAQPNLLPPVPTLQGATPPGQQPAIRMGETLTLSGHHLEGAQVTVRFTPVRSPDTLTLPALPGATSTEVKVRIPPDPAPPALPASSPEYPDNWRIGVHSVAAVIQRTGEPERTTNELAVSLAPRIKSITAGVADDDVTLTVVCSPKVWKTQRVTLVIGDRELVARRINAMKTELLLFQAKSCQLASGDQWVRLRVDGVESLLVDHTEAPPVFDLSQKVTIP